MCPLTDDAKQVLAKAKTEQSENPNNNTFFQGRKPKLPSFLSSASSLACGAVTIWHAW